MISRHENDKRIVEQTNCPNCSSSDAFTIYEKAGKIDGHCFSCEHYSADPYGELEVKVAIPASRPKKAKTKVIGNRVELDEGIQYPIPSGGIPSRKLSRQTCEHYGVRVGVSAEDGVTPLFSLFPQYRSASITGWKTIDNHKNIVSTGGKNVDPFGLNTIKPKGKKLWITEGEYDAMSIFQAIKETSTLDGWQPDVISIPNGVASASNSLASCYDKLIAYDEIIICFDNDEPGIAAREEICKMFAGKSNYVVIPSPYKDASDMLQAGKATELKWLCLSNYKKYEPDGIVNAKDLKEKYFSAASEVFYPFPPTMPLLNKKLYGAWPGSIITLTSGTGCGKTQLTRELMYHFYNTTDVNMAGVFLEEDSVSTLKGLVSLEVNKRITLPDVKITKEVEEKAYDKLFGSGRITLYDYFGGVDDSNILYKLRYLALTGNRIIFLDHLHIVVNETESNKGERERIDSLMKDLAKFVKEFNVVLFLVVQLKYSASGHLSFEQGARPSLDDLKGSSSIKQYSWEVLGFTRNQQHELESHKNIVELSILKSRSTGRTGIVDYLDFNDFTGRMVNIPTPDNFPTMAKKKGFYNDND